MYLLPASAGSKMLALRVLEQLLGSARRPRAEARARATSCAFFDLIYQ